ncbi:MAG TPA: selenocysteine-specific translation elongation factor [Chloroflexota bacterium]|nr:selenocysteine-specific translation elongation factor [Chloroflexota bacterium]
MDGDDARPGIVVGVAGHIDHGKSALVQALTGVDPDRLPEEKARGMTIDLGFAPCRLPSGRTVSLVDVPGHERFIANMVAGATGINAALLVVSAEEGVKPQTREHLDVLDLLGVTSGVVAITKSDLADAAGIAEARRQIVELLAHTSLRDAPVVPVSAVTGTGLDDLLDRVEAMSVTDRPASGFARLPIDRVFSRPGFGTVVTGTLLGGSLTTGEEVDVSPGGPRARIRGIQIHGLTIGKADAPARVAVNLATRNDRVVKRGGVVALPGSLSTVKRFDARIRLLANSPVSLSPGTSVFIHAGTSATSGSAFPLDAGTLEPAQSGWVQVRLDQAQALWRGQRVILRLPSPTRTIGGGIIADVAPRRRARDADAGRLEDLISDDVAAAVKAALQTRRLDRSALCRLLSLPESTIIPVVSCLMERDEIAPCGKTYAGIAQIHMIAGRMLDRLAGYHERFPMRSYMPREELRQAARLEPAEMSDILGQMVSRGQVVLSETGGASHSPLSATQPAGVALADHAARFASAATPEIGTGAARLVDALEDSMLAPPPVAELLGRCGLTKEVLRRLTSTGQIVRMDESIYLGRDAYRSLLDEVERLLDTEGAFTIARFRDALGTSRKYALAYAAHLDANLITRRSGDERLPGRNFRAHRN